LINLGVVYFLAGRLKVGEDCGYISAWDYGYDIMVISQHEITTMISGIWYYGYTSAWDYDYDKWYLYNAYLNSSMVSLRVLPTVWNVGYWLQHWTPFLATFWELLLTSKVMSFWLSGFIPQF
jgi:hypothetical protein